MTGIKGKKSLRNAASQSAPPNKCKLQRGHVIESMVKLLTDSFVLQLLSVQLIYQSRGQKACFSKKCRETVQRKRRIAEDTKTGRRQRPKQLRRKTKEENRSVIEYQYENKNTPTCQVSTCPFFFFFLIISHLFFSIQAK